MTKTSRFSCRAPLLVAACVWAAACSSAPVRHHRGVDAEPRPVLVQGSDLAAVRESVQRVGGTITHELGIIRAVAVRLTATQLAALADDPAIVKVYDDRRVEIEAAGERWTVRDGFGAASFANDEGTASWAGPWQELGETNGPDSGTVRVDRDDSRCVGHSDCLRIGGNDKSISGDGVSRAVDLSGASSAELSFYVGRSGESDSGRVTLAVSADGAATWTDLQTYRTGGSQSPTLQSFDLTPYAAGDTRIRFLGSGRTDDGGYVYFDDIEIEFDAAAGGGDAGGGGSGDGTGGGGLLATIRDEFSALVYTGSDGTEDWSATSWTEIDEPDGQGPLDGPVMISRHTTYCLDPPCLRIGGTRPSNPDPGFGVYRDVDLAGASSATLTFSYRRGMYGSADPAGGTLTLDLSPDRGATWTTLETFRFDAVDSSQTVVSVDVSEFLSADARIRFLTHGPDDGVVFFIDNLEVDATQAPPTDYPAAIGADLLQSQDITGRSTTVAVVDTGISPSSGLTLDTHGENRLLATYNALLDRMGSVEDGSGHGTHVASVILNSQRSKQSEPGVFNGTAPDAGLVVVKAFDDNGRGTYADVIRGLDWIVNYKDAYGIRVVNLSFSAEPRSHYWDDPLSQAVMETWRAGIVVVASAGNTGPAPMTIGVPGNVPYVITVGAVSDGVTPDDPSDDFLTSFSSAGPTVEGFVKPEVVAPGGHILAFVDRLALLVRQHFEWLFGDYFYMSGTSQAAAVVSGTVALMLDDSPWLTPDEVKCRVMGSARPAVKADGTLAYSVFQQGAGLVSASGAVASAATGCANRGLDVDRDLAGVEHYGGRANQDANGTFYIMDQSGDGYLWDGSYSWTDAYLWSDAYLWNDAYLWGNAYLWNDAYLWGNAYLWNDAYLWSNDLIEPMSINVWVPQE